MRFRNKRVLREPKLVRSYYSLYIIQYLEYSILYRYPFVMYSTVLLSVAPFCWFWSYQVVNVRLMRVKFCLIFLQFYLDLRIRRVDRDVGEAFDDGLSVGAGDVGDDVVVVVYFAYRGGFIVIDRMRVCQGHQRISFNFEWSFEWMNFVRVHGAVSLLMPTQV